MTNMLASIAPKSDQLNADDLTGGRTITVRITKVSGVTGEQPIAINYEGDNGKPYYPCKSMRRVLVNVWGVDGLAYVGRSLTLYCDPKVLFGGVAVGGIRISHMSHIDKDVTMALTATRANRKPFTVKPLHSVTVHAPNQAAIDAARNAAIKGTDALKAFWEGLTMAQQKSLKDLMPELKIVAEKADQPPETPAPLLEETSLTTTTEGCSDEPDATNSAN